MPTRKHTLSLLHIRTHTHIHTHIPTTWTFYISLLYVSIWIYINLYIEIDIICTYMLCVYECVSNIFRHDFFLYVCVYKYMYARTRAYKRTCTRMCVCLFWQAWYTYLWICTYVFPTYSSFGKQWTLHQKANVFICCLKHTSTRLVNILLWRSWATLGWRCTCRLCVCHCCWCCFSNWCLLICLPSFRMYLLFADTFQPAFQGWGVSH